MPRLFGSKMKYKKSLVRNIKRAGGVSTVGRSVHIASGSRCQCDNAVWCPLTNGKGFKLTAPKDCNVFIKSIDSILIGGVVSADGLAKAGEVITINFTANQRLNIAGTTIALKFGVAFFAGNAPVLTETSGATFRYKITYTVAAGDDGALSFTITPVPVYRIGKNPTSAAVTLTADRNGNTVTADTTFVTISSMTWTAKTGAAAARALTASTTKYVLAPIGDAMVATVTFSEALSAAPTMSATGGVVAQTGSATGTANQYEFTFTSVGAANDDVVGNTTITAIDKAGNTAAINGVASGVINLITDDEQPQFTITADQTKTAGAVTAAAVNHNAAVSPTTIAADTILFTFTLNTADWTATRTAANGFPEILANTLLVGDIDFVGHSAAGVGTLTNTGTNKNGPYTLIYTMQPGDITGTNKDITVNIPAATVNAASTTGVDNLASKEGTGNTVTAFIVKDVP
jgi:hypothetical protein